MAQRGGRAGEFDPRDWPTYGQSSRVGESRREYGQRWFASCMLANQGDETKCRKSRSPLSGIGRSIAGVLNPVSGVLGGVGAARRQRKQAQRFEGAMSRIDMEGFYSEFGESARDTGEKEQRTRPPLADTKVSLRRDVEGRDHGPPTQSSMGLLDGEGSSWVPLALAGLLGFVVLKKVL